jgi:hypothetical protein
MRERRRFIDRVGVGGIALRLWQVEQLALFSFRFCVVHPKDVHDCQLQQFFEVPPMQTNGRALMLAGLA